MKKITTLSLALVLLLFGIAACKKAGPPAAGSATATDMLSLIPKSAQGVVVLDVHAALNTAFVDKMLKEGEDKQKYLDFIKDTGIDPQKDIYLAVIGLMGTGGLNNASPAIVVNLKYDKDKLLAKLKEKATNVTEEVYEGLTLYTVPEADDKKPMTGVFYDASNIILGEAKDVKAVIDVVKKGGENILKNETLSALLKSADKSAIVWAAVAFPPDMMKSVAAQNPMASSLENMKSLLVALNYKNKALQIEIKGMGGDAEKNKQTAEALNGLKALGAMASTEKPEIGELVNKIEVTSSAEFVKIAANFPEELLTKLGATAKLAGTKPEEKKDEKKEDPTPINK
jgi:ribosomal protein L30E